MPYLEKGFEKTESEFDFTILVARLPKQQQEVVILRYAHNLKMREIAEVLDEPMRTVQTRLRTALKRLVNGIEGETPYA